MSNKFGKYISDLMLMVIESEQDSTVFQLSISELKKLNSDISDFIQKNLNKEETSNNKKTLLQEKKDESN